MAPRIGQDWQATLRSLVKNWDSHNGRPISEAAIATLEGFYVTPTTDGGVQLEVHRDTFDIEICIGPDGRIESALVCCEPRKGKP